MLKNIFSNVSGFGCDSKVAISKDLVKRILKDNACVVEIDMVDKLYGREEIEIMQTDDAKIILSCMKYILFEAALDFDTDMTDKESNEMLEAHILQGIISFNDFHDLSIIMIKYGREAEDKTLAKRAFITRGIVKYLKACNR